MRTIYIFLVALFLNGEIFGQDILGAYIQAHLMPSTNTFTPVYDYSISLTLITDASKNISRPTVTVDFGDVSTGTLTLNSTLTTNGVSIKKYSGRHTYAGPSGILYYEVAYLDSHRVSAIKNISNSGTQNIYASYKIYANQLSWANVPAKISNFPPVLGLSGNQAVFNPMVSDEEGDSLSFTLVNCYGNNYHIPTGAVLNPTTGVLTFSKDSIGLYAFCVKVYEWKKDGNNVPKYSGVTQMDFLMDINATVGIFENTVLHEKIKVYPNPANGIVNIECKDSDAKLFLINTLGETALYIDNMDNKQFVDVSTLPKGIYYVRIENIKGSSVTKMVIE